MLHLAFKETFSYQGVGETGEYIPYLMRPLGIRQYTMVVPILWNGSVAKEMTDISLNRLQLVARPMSVLQYLRERGIELAV